MFFVRTDFFFISFGFAVGGYNSKVESKATFPEIYTPRRLFFFWFLEVS